jgi:chemotaxis protein CheY-P-specific phosphatase CheC
VAKSIFDSQGISAWGAYTDGRYKQYMGQARAVAPSVLGSGNIGGAGVGVGVGGVTSTANQAQALQQGLQGLSQQETRLTKALEELVKWLSQLGDAQALEKESLTEQQLAERAQFEFEQRKALLTAEIMNTPNGRLGVAAGDAVSGGISGSLSGAMQALLNGGDVKQAVTSALSDAGQQLMQATLDALLNPLLEQIQDGIFKVITGKDVSALALQKAGVDLNKAAWVLMEAGQVLIGNGGTGAAAVKFGTNPFGIGPTILGLLGGFSGAVGLDFGIPALTGIPDFSSAFTPGRAGGGEVKYGLDYLVGEKNAEIVRFNKAGGKIYSNRALTQALGVPFQRTPGGGAAVADGGGDSLGVPFMGAGSTRAANASNPGVPFMGGSTARAAGGGDSLGIPFLKASPGAGGGMALGGPARGGPGGGGARSSSLRLSLETQVINGVEYATVQQVRDAAAAAAEAGRDSAYDGIRNNPSIQSSLGMR